MTKPYEKIHVSTFEEFFKTEDWRRNWVATNRPEDLAGHDKRMEDRQKKRDEYRVKYPYTVILEGAYPEHDFVSRWCWRNIGPMQCEKCHDHQSEYPGCPLVLATEYIQRGWYNTSDGKRVDWTEKAYKEAEEGHGHEGTWMAYWLGKTGYDYGFSEYYFENEQDRDRFLAAAPTFTLGEKYEEGAE